MVEHDGGLGIQVPAGRTCTEPITWLALVPVGCWAAGLLGPTVALSVLVIK